MLKNYPGAKTNSGIIQFMVNEIPYHEGYYELCAGSAQLYFAKKPAAYSYLNDINPGVCRELEQMKLYDRTFISNQPVVDCLLELAVRPGGTAKFVYLDPPYPRSARRSGAKIYKNEMLDDCDHEQLLTAVLDMDANVMISTSPNDLYDHMLNNWRKLVFNTMGHRGPRVEVIYMNYDKPVILHQYDKLGKDYIERQAIDRKVKRWVNKIGTLPLHQKHLLIQQLINNDPAAVQHFLTVSAGKQSHK